MKILQPGDWFNIPDYFSGRAMYDGGRYSHWKNGKLHGLSTIVYNSCQWYIEGKRSTKEEFMEKTKHERTTLGKLIYGEFDYEI